MSQINAFKFNNRSAGTSSSALDQAISGNENQPYSNRTRNHFSNNGASYNNSHRSQRQPGASNTNMPSAFDQAIAGFDQNKPTKPYAQKNHYGKQRRAYNQRKNPNSSLGSQVDTVMDSVNDSSSSDDYMRPTKNVAFSKAINAADNDNVFKRQQRHDYQKPYDMNQRRQTPHDNSGFRSSSFGQPRSFGSTALDDAIDQSDSFNHRSTAGSSLAFTASQPSAFNQPFATAQASSFNNPSAFGQTSAFNSSPAFNNSSPVNNTPAYNNAWNVGNSSAFNNSSIGNKSSWPGQGPPPYHQISSHSEASLFQESPSNGKSETTFNKSSTVTNSPAFTNQSAFGSTSAFTNHSAFGSTPAFTNRSAFGNQSAFTNQSAFNKPSAFTNTSAFANSSTSFGQPSLSGQSAFSRAFTSTSSSEPQPKDEVSMIQKQSFYDTDDVVSGEGSQAPDEDLQNEASERVKKPKTPFMSKEYRRKKAMFLDDEQNTLAHQKPPVLQQTITPTKAESKIKKKSAPTSIIANSTNISTKAPNQAFERPKPKAPMVAAVDRAKRFGSTGNTAIYEEFKKNRIEERRRAIKDGLIPDPNNPTRLEDAIDFRGTCLRMCPAFEMIEREIQKGLDSLEMDEDGVADPDKMVKAYRRSAAGNDQPLPSDVRTPEALEDTLNYLLNDVLSNYPLERCHAFIRDRTRSIRQDFTLQNIRDETAVYIHEKIARFHILCLHEMCELEESKFSVQQETEQLRKVLLSLIEFYDDLREEGIETPNEAEFRAYFIITHIRDQDVVRQAQTLPVYLFKDPLIQRALEFHALAQRNNEILETSSRRNKPENTEASENFYSKFFGLIEDGQTPFLMACLLESHFADVRKGALKAMNLAYMLKAGGVLAEDVRETLKYDTLQQLLKEAHLYGIHIDMSLDEPTLCFGQKHYTAKTTFFIEPLSNPGPTKSLTLVEPKKAKQTFTEIINGEAPSPIEVDEQEQRVSTDSQIDMETHNQQLYHQRQQELESVRAKADAAEALAAREREALNALIEKKEKEAKLKREKQLKEEQEKREALARQMEEEAEKLKQKEESSREESSQEGLREQEEMKEVEEKSQEVVQAEVPGQFVDEETVRLVKSLRMKRYLTKKTKPFLHRAKERIAKRNQKAFKVQQHVIFTRNVLKKNPFSELRQEIPEHATAEGIEERVNYSLFCEEYALKDSNTTKGPETVYQKDNFSRYIYPLVIDDLDDTDIPAVVPEDKPEWQLLICVSDLNSNTANWFKSKFGLDEDFYRCNTHYRDVNIKIKMIDYNYPIQAKDAKETRALIFDLPATTFGKTAEQREQYWQECKFRFENYTEKILKYSARKCPVVFTYFKDEENYVDVMKQIPRAVGLEQDEVVSNYHILLMSPATISRRIVDEVVWLARESCKC